MDTSGVLAIWLCGDHPGLYIPLHLAGYLCFLAVGAFLLRRQPRESPYLVMLVVLVILTDTLLAHMAYAVNAKGFSACLDSRHWAFFQAPFWGAPLLFAVCCAPLFLIRRSAILLDATCIAWAASNVFFKLACWELGCCVGRSSSWLWCPWFGGAHPTQLYETLVHASLAILVLLLFRRNLLGGRLVLVVGFVFGFARLGLDSLRQDQFFPVGHLSLTQTIAGSVGTLCGLGLVSIYVRARIQTQRAAQTLPAINSSSPRSRLARGPAEESRVGVHKRRRGRARKRP